MLNAISRSLRLKVVAVVLVTTLVALVVSTLALLWYEARTLRQFVLDDARTQAEIIARSSVPALQFNDRKEATTNLALLANRQQLIAAAIYGADGSEFARFQRDEDAFLPARAPAPREDIDASGILVFSVPMVENGTPLGTIYLRLATDFGERIGGFATILGAVMTVSLAVAGLISVYLQRSVTAPVLAVTDTARRIIDERDFTLRATRTSADEVGVLVDAFNGMLGEVEATTSDLRAANRQLSTETEERRQAEAALRIADRRKDEFLAVLAHELRNPLAPMRTAVHLLRGVPLDERATRSREILARQIEHMVALVDDLLDVSRVTRGTLTLNLATLDLSEVLQHAVETARSHIDARGHTLTIDLPANPVYVRGDAVRLAQVLSNLLNNAAKYTDPGGRIAVDVAVRDAQVVVRVKDTGIGMSPQTLARAFDMFSQGTAEAGDRRLAGLGVGLGLSRQLIDLHGGHLSASSAGVGLGSEFVLILDTVPAPERLAIDTAPTTAPSATESTPQTGEQPMRRILLVDDNVDFVTTLSMLLAARGHSVRIAHDGTSALEVAREHRPDIAFLDIGLPDVPGHELALRLRDMPETAQSMLVAVSGWGQEADRARSRAAGFADHLVKPVDIASILATIATFDATG